MSESSINKPFEDLSQLVFKNHKYVSLFSFYSDIFSPMLKHLDVRVLIKIGKGEYDEIPVVEILKNLIKSNHAMWDLLTILVTIGNYSYDNLTSVLWFYKRFSIYRLKYTDNLFEYYMYKYFYGVRKLNNLTYSQRKKSYLPNLIIKHYIAKFDDIHRACLDRTVCSNDGLSLLKDISPSERFHYMFFEVEHILRQNLNTPCLELNHAIPIEQAAKQDIKYYTDVCNSFKYNPKNDRIITPEFGGWGTPINSDVSLYNSIIQKTYFDMYEHLHVHKLEYNANYTVPRYRSEKYKGRSMDLFDRWLNNDRYKKLYEYFTAMNNGDLIIPHIVTHYKDNKYHYIAIFIKLFCILDVYKQLSNCLDILLTVDLTNVQSVCDMVYYMVYVATYNSPDRCPNAPAPDKLGNTISTLYHLFSTKYTIEDLLYKYFYGHSDDDDCLFSWINYQYADIVKNRRVDEYNIIHKQYLEDLTYGYTSFMRVGSFIRYLQYKLELGDVDCTEFGDEPCMVNINVKFIHATLLTYLKLRHVGYISSFEDMCNKVKIPQCICRK